LKTKLNARYAYKVGKQIMKRLTNVNSQDTDFIKQRFAVSVGEFKEAKTSLAIALSFASIAESDLLGAQSIASLSFNLKSGATNENIAETKKSFEEILKAADVPIKVTSDLSAGQLKVTMGLPGPDPFALASQLGIDLQAFIKEVSLSLELSNQPKDFIDTNNKSTKLADLVNFRLVADLQFRKALIHTLANNVAELGDLIFVSWVENLILGVNLGHFTELILAIIPPDGMQDQVTDPDINKAINLLSKAVSAKSKTKLKDLYLAMWETPLSNPLIAAIVTAAKVSCEQFSEIHYHTSSGLALTFSIKDLFPFALIPNKAD